MDDSKRPRQYRVVVRGRLSPRFAQALRGVAVATGSGADTTLLATLDDDAAVYGLLDRLRDLGIELVGVDAVD